jgi:tRNA A37 threonylcarbamoyladenosine dehydratase
MTERRFSGVERLWGVEGADRLRDASVTVVGVGGVGSWVVEALARTGISRLRLIDADHVAESNINRQLPALENTFGRLKADVLAERVQLINPQAHVDVVDDFVTLENIESLFSDQSWVIDAIDNYRVKAAMIAHCSRRKQPIITIGAAGGQVDCTRVRVSDLYRTEQDALLAKTRKLLRQDYGFSSNLKRRFGVHAVWSDEPVRQSQACESQQDSSLNCAGFGAAMTVTASFGLAAADYVIRQIATKI